MSDGTLEQRTDKLLSTLIDMNNGIFGIQKALAVIAFETKDKNARDKIMKHIEESLDSMSEAMENVQEFINLRRNS